LLGYLPALYERVFGKRDYCSVWGEIIAMSDKFKGDFRLPDGAKKLLATTVMVDKNDKKTTEVYNAMCG